MGKRVRTPEGAKKYGKPIGSPLGGGSARNKVIRGAKAMLTGDRAAAAKKDPAVQRSLAQMRAADGKMTPSDKTKQEIATKRSLAQTKAANGKMTPSDKVKSEIATSKKPDFGEQLKAANRAKYAGTAYDVDRTEADERATIAKMMAPSSDKAKLRAAAKRKLGK